MQINFKENRMENFGAVPSPGLREFYTQAIKELGSSSKYKEYAPKWIENMKDTFNKITSNDLFESDIVELERNVNGNPYFYGWLKSCSGSYVKKHLGIGYYHDVNNPADYPRILNGLYESLVAIKQRFFQ